MRWYRISTQYEPPGKFGYRNRYQEGKKLYRNIPINENWKVFCASVVLCKQQALHDATFLH